MRSIKGWFLAAACVALFAHSASATSVFFDFGYSNQGSAGSNYNDVNVDGPTGGPAQPIVVTNLIDSTGANTGIDLSLSGFFRGGNNNGTQTPTGVAASIFVPSATRDNAFTHVGDWGTPPTKNPKGSVVLTGLNDSTAYDFTMFASRMGVTDNRETLYTVTGSNSASATLNAANNTSDVATISGIYPSGGSITLNVEKGPNNTNGVGFAYLGALRMEYTAVPEPTTLGLLGLSSLGLVFRRRFV